MDQYEVQDQPVFIYGFTKFTLDDRPSHRAYLPGYENFTEHYESCRKNEDSELQGYVTHLSQQELDVLEAMMAVEGEDYVRFQTDDVVIPNSNMRILGCSVFQMEDHYIEDKREEVVPNETQNSN